jgi:myo-inositol-1(or 4)-monophosphatase
VDGGTVTPGEWLAVFESVGARMRTEVAPLLGTEAGRVELGQGAGGDRTVELDRRAEQRAMTELGAIAEGGCRFSLLSEEAGLVDFGAEFPRVLLDPVDGSLNAKRGLPVAAVMFTLLEGPHVEDARAGHVLNLVSGERWGALKGAGATLDDRPLAPMRAASSGRLEVLALETSARSLLLARALVERASKVRLLGSMALSLAHTAAGGMDLFCSPVAGRVFDITASVLMITESGGVVTDLSGAPIGGLVADLTTRSTLLCSAHPDLHRMGLELMSA